jgi:hypothetical protein
MENLKRAERAERDRLALDAARQRDAWRLAAAVNAELRQLLTEITGLPYVTTR